MSTPEKAAPREGPSIASIFGRSESPDVVNWIQEHEPDSAPVIVARHISHRSGIPNQPPPKHVYNPEEELARRKALIAKDALAASSPQEHADSLTDEDYTVQYSRTLVCDCTKADLWKMLLQKARNPTSAESMKLSEASAGTTCGVRSKIILSEGPDYLFRNVELVTGEVLREKVTWDEEDENVRCDLIEDSEKSGYIQSAISVDASGHVCLTVSCDYRFVPSESLTPEKLAQWRKLLRTCLDSHCAATVRLVEEQVHLAAIEKRERDEAHEAKEKELADQKQQVASTAAAMPDAAGVIHVAPKKE